MSQFVVYPDDESDLVPPADPDEGLDPDEICGVCLAELLWDRPSGTWYCPNTWHHG